MLRSATSIVSIVLYLLALGPAAVAGVPTQSSIQGRISTDFGKTNVAGVELYLFVFDDLAEEWFPYSLSGGPDAVSMADGTYAITPDGDNVFPEGDYKLFTYNAAGFIDEVRTILPGRSKGLDGNDQCGQRECFLDVDILGTAIELTSVGQPVTVFADFDLEDGNSISGTVQDSGATPAVDAEVCVFDAATDEKRFCTLTGAGGIYQTPGFSLTSVHVAVTETRDPDTFSVCDGTGEQGTNPRAYMVPEVADGSAGYFTFLGGQGANLDTAATFSPAPSATVSFSLDRGVVFCGRVRDESNNDLAGQFVKFYDPMGALVYLTDFGRDLDPGGVPGRYETPALPVGTYYFVGGSVDPLPTPHVKEIYDGVNGIYCQTDQCASLAPDLGQSIVGATGREHIVDFALAPGARLSGAINGQFARAKGTPSPLDDVKICAHESTGAGEITCIRSDSGSYDFGLLPRQGTKLYAEGIAFGGTGVYVPKFSGGATALPKDFGNAATIDLTEGDKTESFLLAPGGRISGQVIDDLTESPVSTFVFEIYSSAGTFLTSASPPEAVIKGPLLNPGTYATLGLPAGNYRIVIEGTDDPGLNGEQYLDEIYDRADGRYCVLEGSCDPLAGALFAVGLGENTFDGDLTLGGSLLGRVDPDTAPGTGIAGAKVQVFDEANALVVNLEADGDGIYGAHLPPGNYFLQTDVAGFQNEVFDDMACPAADCGESFPPAGVTPTTVAISTSAAAQMKDFALGVETYDVSGEVSEAMLAKGLTPIDGAQICAFDDLGEATGRCTFSDASGLYVLTGLPEGEYYLTATASGFQSQVYNGRDCEGACVPTDGDLLTVSSNREGINFSLAELITQFTISGTVFDTTPTFKGVPGLAGATVCFFDALGDPAGACVLTSGDGSFESDPLDIGTYFATAGKEGFVTELYSGLSCDSCDVTTGTAIVLDAAATGIDFLLSPAPTGSISGTIVLDLNDTPIANVDVLAIDGAGLMRGMGTSDEAGAYVIEGLGLGTYFVYADGDPRGFFNEIYAGAEDPGIVCVPEDCAADAPVVGAPVSVAVRATVIDVDFELGSGSEIVAPAAEELDKAGAAVAICGPRMAIGAPGDDEAGPDAGAVFIYLREGSGYQFFEKLLPTPEEGGGTVDGLMYGSSLACSGDTLVVGAPADGVVAKGGQGGATKASAFIMQMAGNGTGFQQLQQMVGENLGMGPGSGFGSSVGLEGSTMAIGAPAQENKGAVSVLTFDGGAQFPWQQSQVLSDPDASDGAQFGAAVGVGSGGEIGVGSPTQTDDNGLTSGVAQMFTTIAGTNDWTTVGKITNPNGPGNGNGFGASVSLVGGTIAVGAPGDDTAGENAGAAAIFQFNGSGFVGLANLLPGDGVGGESFGSSVSLVNGQIAVGAQNGNGAVAGSGAAYLFALLGGTWQQTDKVSPLLGSPGGLFGAAVAFDGETLLVGSPNALTSGGSTGKAEAFTDPDVLFSTSFEE